jgi:hypothetical protein
VDVSILFQDMPWSTDQVLAITRQRLITLNHRVCFLPPLRDIDTPADLLAYHERPNPTAHQLNRLLSELRSFSRPSQNIKRSPLSVW